MPRCRDGCDAAIPRCVDVRELRADARADLTPSIGWAARRSPRAGGDRRDS
uniref:Uncharacterized protein n=1 Tax=Oryza sativa subsp. japonica TaxID=39947 RepID=Q6ET97_ORYSJ|nr:hypothetical protein [Oryza sativa Japonica Group]BAD28123.1 hypothetical protein [Oryza sativa Japonica Group]